MNTQTIGVIGAGVMGRGIAQLFAQTGHDVRLFDSTDGAIDQGIAQINAMIEKLVSKQKISAQQAKESLARVYACENMLDLAQCDLVIEAIVEDLEIKRGLFKQLEEVVSPETILVSNTSSLLIADIAAACDRPERVAGLHFFNPVPLMKVAEVISSVRTSESVITTLCNLVSHTGHRAVVAQDQPGFLVNHAGRGLYTEGLRLLEEGVATHAEIDRTLKQACGFRMGPFELLDLTGLDVSGKVMESIYQQFQQEDFFRPSSLVPVRVSAGLFGRKAGEGWYDYQDGQNQQNNTPKPPVSRTEYPVWVDPVAAQAEQLKTLFDEAGANLVDQPTDDSLLVIQPYGVDATHFCVNQGLDSSRCIAVDPIEAIHKHRTMMVTPVIRAEYRDMAWALLAKDSTPVTVINDSPGFIVQRVLAMIINIATNIAQRQIASVEDIEDAVTLGLGYPQGPLSWGDELGADKVLEILDGIYNLTKDPRYRATLWLRRRAELGVSLLTPNQVT